MIQRGDDWSVKVGDAVLADDPRPQRLLKGLFLVPALHLLWARAGPSLCHWGAMTQVD